MILRSDKIIFFMEKFQQLYVFEASQGRLRIVANVLRVGNDVQIILAGGEAHLGAVALATPHAPASVATANGHREDQLAARMANYLACALKCNVAVCAGIHYNNISRSEIKQVLALCESLTEKIASSFLAHVAG